MKKKKDEISIRSSAAEYLSNESIEEIEALVQAIDNYRPVHRRYG